jgi:Fungal Zn(2)-Cys(6) binuclear cluster domain
MDLRKREDIHPPALPEAPLFQVTKKSLIRRVKTACAFCKRSKLKCSGIYPCQRCVSQEIDCIFEVKSKKRSRHVEKVDGSFHNYPATYSQYSSAPAHKVPYENIVNPHQEVSFHSGNPLHAPLGRNSHLYSSHAPAPPPSYVGGSNGYFHPYQLPFTHEQHGNLSRRDVELSSASMVSPLPPIGDVSATSYSSYLDPRASSMSVAASATSKIVAALEASSSSMPEPLIEFTTNPAANLERLAASGLSISKHNSSFMNLPAMKRSSFVLENLLQLTEPLIPSLEEEALIAIFFARHCPSSALIEEVEFYAGLAACANLFVNEPGVDQDALQKLLSPIALGSPSFKSLCEGNPHLRLDKWSRLCPEALGFRVLYYTVIGLGAAVLESPCDQRYVDIAVVYSGACNGKSCSYFASAMSLLGGRYCFAGSLLFGLSLLCRARITTLFMAGTHAMTRFNIALRAFATLCKDDGSSYLPLTASSILGIDLFAPQFAPYLVSQPQGSPLLDPMECFSSTFLLVYSKVLRDFCTMTSTAEFNAFMRELEVISSVMAQNLILQRQLKALQVNDMVICLEYLAHLHMNLSFKGTAQVIDAIKRCLTEPGLFDGFISRGILARVVIKTHIAIQTQVTSSQEPFLNPSVRPFYNLQDLHSIIRLAASFLDLSKPFSPPGTLPITVHHETKSPEDALSSSYIASYIDSVEATLSAYPYAQMYCPTEMSMILNKKKDHYGSSHSSGSHGGDECGYLNLLAESAATSLTSFALPGLPSFSRETPNPPNSKSKTLVYLQVKVVHEASEIARTLLH